MVMNTAESRTIVGSQVLEAVTRESVPLEHAGIWGSLKPASGAYRVADGEKLLSALDGIFAPNQLIESGVCITVDGKLRLAECLKTGAAYLAEYGLAGAQPYDFLTAQGCLSGRLP